MMQSIEIICLGSGIIKEHFWSTPFFGVFDPLRMFLYISTSPQQHNCLVTQVRTTSWSSAKHVIAGQPGQVQWWQNLGKFLIITNITSPSLSRISLQLIEHLHLEERFVLSCKSLVRWQHCPGDHWHCLPSSYVRTTGHTICSSEMFRSWLTFIEV